MPGGRLSESAAERELLKYLPSFQLPSYHPDAVPISSPDPTLTALAQLGVLRLRASRCFISLFTKTHQYIIAEATPTLSLQSDKVYQTGDRLWFGSAIIPRNAGPCSVLLDRHVHAYNEGRELPDLVTVVPDLREDSELRATQLMDMSPVPRFYSGVPLKTSRGAIIGYYSVLDNEPRAALDAIQVQFLKDMATTVMANLLGSRVREEYRQGERMIRGISSFVEGRGSLRNWRAMSGQDERSYEPSRARLGGEGQLDQRQQAIQDEEDGSYGMSNAIREATGFEQEDGTHTFNNRLMSRTTFATQRRDSIAGSSQGWGSSQSHHVSSNIAESTATMFSRATNVIRECLEIEGAIFYETSATDHSLSSTSLQPGDPISESSDVNSDMLSSGTEHDSSTDLKSADRMCPVISFSDSNNSSVNHESSVESYMKFPEKFLKSLLRRYPQGNIFHFDNRGNLSSGSSEGDSQEDLETAIKQCLAPHEIQLKQFSPQKKKRAIRPQDGTILLQIFPGARSIALVPLWDSHKEKWHASGFIWTKRANRSFTKHGHLSFLEAIGSVIMTEVARLSALASERAKTDLLGSISHELRSPLHGVLGCVELLEESPQSAFQTEMLQSIEGCGRTLLETIEQLLDFSKINNVASRRKHSPRQRLAFKTSPASQPGDSAIRLDIVTEEVVSAVSFGFDAQRKSATPSIHDRYETSYFAPGSREGLPSNGNRPTIILDIDKSVDMAFLTTPGSWRRIVMNLFANAMKYTTSGYIRISLTAKSARQKNGNKIHWVNFTIADTGQGMSAEYLRDKLFKPFSQENNLVSGTGLGLSIVKQIVDSCNGKIKVESVQNKGTKISVSMYAEVHQSEPLQSTEELKVREVKQVAERTLGKSARLLNSSNFSSGPEIQRPQEDVLEQALKKMCRNWFGFELHDEIDSEGNTSDFYLIVEPNTQGVRLDFSKLGVLASKVNNATKPILLVVCRSLQSKQEMMAAYTELLPSSCIMQYIVQPFGVHKLAISLSHALNQQAQTIPEVRKGLPNGLYLESRNSISAPSLIPNTAMSPPATSELDKWPEGSDYFSPKPVVNRFPVSPNGFPKSPGARPGILRQASRQKSITEDSDHEDSREPSPVIDKVIAGYDTFLLVDDNPINLKILTAHVNRRKAPFVTADNGLKALDVYKSNPAACSVILMDISMPVMDGLESTRAIRAYEKQQGLNPSIILIITGLASAHVQSETKLSGADMYLAKPVGLKELDAVVAGLRERRSTRHGR